MAPILNGLAAGMDDLAAAPGDRDVRQEVAQRAMDLAGWLVAQGGEIPVHSLDAAAAGAVRMVVVDVMIFAGADPSEAFAAAHADSPSTGTGADDPVD